MSVSVSYSSDSVSNVCFCAWVPVNLMANGISLDYLCTSVLARHTLQRYCHVISKNCNVLFCYK